MKKQKNKPLTTKQQVLITAEEIPLLSGHNCGYCDDDVKSAVEGLKSNINPIHPYGKHMLEIIDYWFPVFKKDTLEG